MWSRRACGGVLLTTEITERWPMPAPAARPRRRFSALSGWKGAHTLCLARLLPGSVRARGGSRLLAPLVPVLQYVKQRTRRELATVPPRPGLWPVCVLPPHLAHVPHTKPHCVHFVGGTALACILTTGNARSPSRHRALSWRSWEHRTKRQKTLGVFNSLLSWKVISLLEKTFLSSPD